MVVPIPTPPPPAPKPDDDPATSTVVEPRQPQPDVGFGRPQPARRPSAPTVVDMTPTTPAQAGGAYILAGARYEMNLGTMVS